MAWSEKAIEEAAKKIFAHRGPEHMEWGDFAYEQSEYRVCAKAAIDAAAAIDGNAQWNEAIEAAAGLIDTTSQIIGRDWRPDADNIARAIRSLKRG